MNWRLVERARPCLALLHVCSNNIQIESLCKLTYVHMQTASRVYSKRLRNSSFCPMDDQHIVGSIVTHALWTVSLLSLHNKLQIDMLSECHISYHEFWD